MRIVDSTSFGEVRAAFSAKKHAVVSGVLQSAKFTLGGLLEAAAWIADTSHADDEGRSILARTAPKELKAVSYSLSRGATLSIRFADNGVASARSISRLDSNDRPWTEYLMSFHAALVADGYDKSYARALAQSFHEMADNVRQHAGNTGESPPPGVAGWHVAGGVAAFTVVDTGRGMRASLSTSSHWAHLQSEREALLAVVRDRATRKAANKFGDGYNTVVQNFVSRNGCLSLRSRDAELVASGTITEGTIRMIASSPVTGTRVSARCAPRHRHLPEEPTL